MSYTPEHLSEKINTIKENLRNCKNDLVDLVYKESDLSSYWSESYIESLEEAVVDVNNILKKI